MILCFITLLGLTLNLSAASATDRPAPVVSVATTAIDECQDNLREKFVIMSNKTSQVAELISFSNGRVANWIADNLPTVDGSPLEILQHKLALTTDENILYEISSLAIEGSKISAFELIQRIRKNELDDLIGREMTWTLYLAHRSGDGIWISQGEVHGTLVRPNGIGGMGFDSVFMPDGATQTLAAHKPITSNARWLAYQALDQRLGQIMPLPTPWTGAYRSQDVTHYNLDRLTEREVQWINNSQFHAMQNGPLLDEIGERVRQAVARGEKPIVVFDLDETLLDNRIAVRSLFQDWLTSVEATMEPALLQDLRQKTVSTFLGSTADQYKEKLQLGEPYATAWKEYFRSRFFTNEYTSQASTPFVGASLFLRLLQEAGAHIVYMTGRIGPSQGPGTLETLKRLGFPLVSDSDLICKWDRIPTAEYKANSIRLIQQMGTIIAVLDNEPANLVQVKQVLSDDESAANIYYVLVTTEFERLPKEAVAGFYRTNTWLSESQRQIIVNGTRTERH